LNYSNAEADVQFSYWQALCYLTPLIGGIFADSVWNRYRTILLFSTLYLIGLVVVEVSIIPGKLSPGTFFLGIYVVALGTGGIKPNVSTLGADQFNELYSQDRKEKESFFNWFYWSINLGALLSYTIVSYICQYGLSGLGGEDYSFIVGYSIPTMMMGMAILVFLSGTRRYTVAEPQGSVLITATKIVYEAVWKKRNANRCSQHVLDKAKISQGGSFTSSSVEGVKAVVRLMPFLIALIPFWGVYSQMSTVFQNQGCQMNLELGGFPIPVSALNIFDTIAILLLVPVFDGFVYPYMKKIGRPLSMLTKIGLGLGFALLSMCCACLIEYFRLKAAPSSGNYYDESARDNITPCQSIDDYNPYNYQGWLAGTVDDQPLYCHQTCSVYLPNGLLDLDCISCDDIPQMSNISVLAQIPQFVLIGISEILASITSLEFFYSQAPLSMRSVSQAFNLVTTSIGSLLIVPLVYLVNSDPNNEWLPVNLDDGHVTYYFMVLAGIMILDMIYFYYISLTYEYKTTMDLTFKDEDEMTFDYIKDMDSSSAHLNQPLLVSQNQSTSSGTTNNGDNEVLTSYDNYEDIEQGQDTGETENPMDHMVGIRASNLSKDRDAEQPQGGAPVMSPLALNMNDDVSVNSDSK
jgi:solute carrier family 15 (peptide/histidine transporter), member 3/4